ncbi:MAG: MBL fold metallo-hydrolase [Actinomycetota bacterium]|nr:MBL fold metallo-hydrolase [Actinomycetota bacterium]
MGKRDMLAHDNRMVDEVCPSIFLLRKTHGSNVYLIQDTELFLIDAGFPLDAKKISNAVSQFGTHVCMVATHYHLDHVGSMKMLSENFGWGIAAHEDDALVMEGKIPYEIFEMEPLKRLYYRLLAPLYKYEFVTVDSKLIDGDFMDVIEGLKVIHIPGHTEGSIALYSESRKILFSGDTLRCEKGILEGPPPKFNTNIEQAYKSIREKLLDLDFETLLPGHGVPILKNARKEVVRMLRES